VGALRIKGTGRQEERVARGHRWWEAPPLPGESASKAAFAPSGLITAKSP
jgi:hypothetical protein